MNVVKSLTGHRKDTFTLFIIYVVSIVTVFVFISFFNSSYETVKSINETVNVDIYLKNDVNNSYSSQFVETCDDILETIGCKGGMNIRSTVGSAMLGYDSIDIVSYEPEFNNEHYSIEGKTPSPGSNEIMVSSNLKIETGDYLRSVNIGDIFVFEIDEESFEMEVCGVFQKIESDSFTENYSIYPSYNTIIIGDRQFILDNLDFELSLSDMAFTLRGSESRDYILNSLNNLVESDNNNHYTIEVDDSLIKRLEQPVKNTIELYRIIMFLVAMVLVILVSYAIFHTVSQRRREYGILMCLGMKRKEIGAMFILENMMILILAFVISIPLSLSVSKLIAANMNQINSVRQMELSLITDIVNYNQNTADSLSIIMFPDYIKVMSISVPIIDLSALFSVLFVTRGKIRELVNNNLSNK
ncbi:MAG: ABC transporter permease [Erysipelotrichaceae bacterium]